MSHAYWAPDLGIPMPSMWVLSWKEKDSLGRLGEALGHHRGPHLFSCLSLSLHHLRVKVPTCLVFHTSTFGLPDIQLWKHGAR